MSILCLGLSHQTAPVELRERLNYSPEALQTALTHFGNRQPSSLTGLSELAILSTCNRVELYAVAPDEAPSLDTEFIALRDFLAETRGVPSLEFEPHVYHYAGLPAVEHLCRVAAGLDSLILGEPQILGQVIKAYESGLAASALGSVLTAVFRTAIHVGKGPRTENRISHNPASLSSVAVRLAEQIMGDLTSQRVLVIGAGEMGTLAVAALRARGVQRLTLVNRTYQTAQVLAQRWGIKVQPYEHLAQALRAADLVISATATPQAIIKSEMIRPALAGRDYPLVLIDIALPRNIEPQVANLPGIQLIDLEQLQARLEGALADRRNEIPKVEAILVEELASFDAWLRGADMLPLIAELRTKAERIRQHELARTLHYLPDLDPAARQHIERLSQSLVNKLLHEPTRHIRAEAAGEQAAHYAQTVRQLFGLDEPATLDADSQRTSGDQG